MDSSSQHSKWSKSARWSSGCRVYWTWLVVDKTPLKNMRSKKLGWLFHSQYFWENIIQSCSRKTTNQEQVVQGALATSQFIWIIVCVEEHRNHLHGNGSHDIAGGLGHTGKTCLSELRGADGSARPLIWTVESCWIWGNFFAANQHLFDLFWGPEVIPIDQYWIN